MRISFKPNKQTLVVGAICAAVLVGFTVFAILDKIVLSHEVASEATTDQTENLGAVNTYAGSLDTVDVTTGEDGVVYTRYRWKNTNITVADIYLQNPQQLRSAIAYDTFGYNILEPPVSFAERTEAVVMVNGDFYGLYEDGYVIRDGVLYRSSPAVTGHRYEDCVVMNDGSFKIIKESEISAAELMAQGVWQLLSFGPALVNNGESLITQENFSNGYVHEASQRCAIAWVDDLHYRFIVCAGRTNTDTGLKMWDWADFIAMLGCKVAYNLDGGDSAYMFKGTQLITDDVSRSSTFRPEAYGNGPALRWLSDVVYIKKA